MSQTVLLCLVLFVGSVSAWGNWFSLNRETECGKFRTNRWRWFFDDSVTDVNTRKVLANIKAMDANKDGYVTFAENFDQPTFNRVNAPMNLTAGISRCELVKFDMVNYNMDKEVSSAIFSLADTNGDLIGNMQDTSPEIYLLSDRDGDGRVSVCENFRSFMDAIAIAERQVYLRKLKYQNLVYKFRKPYWHSWW